MSERPGSYAVLRLPLYRRFLAAAISYSVGMWTFQTVLVWVVLEQTGSAGAVSLLLICLTVSWLLISLPAGILADRYDLRRLMLIGQGVAACAMAGAAIATLAGVMSLGVAMVALFVLGIFDGLSGVPAMVFVGRLVEPRLMAGAIGLSSLQYGFGRILGGLMTGLLVSLIGAGPTIALAAALLGVSALIVFTLPSLRRAETSPGRARLGDLTAAVRWVGASRPSIAIMVLGLCAAVFIYSYFTMLPILAQDILGAGSAGLGFLTSAGGVGILVGSLVTDVVGRRIGRGRAVVVTLLLAALAYAALGVSTVLPLSLVLTGAMTIGVGIYRVTSQLLLQHLAPARMRGRVLAVFELSFWGTYPLGTLAAGRLADRFGGPAVIVSFALLTVLASGVVLIFARSLVRLDVDRDGQIVPDRRRLGGPVDLAPAAPSAPTAPVE
ncbi:MAG: MFS transporter [Chloroflexi bacterium]|nr:MFS transporter [Chloroflexota bacterium]